MKKPVSVVFKMIIYCVIVFHVSGYIPLPGTFAVVSIMSGQAIDKVMEVIRQDRSEAPIKTLTVPTVSAYTVGSGGGMNSSIGGDFPSSGVGGGDSTALFASGEEALLRAQVGALLALMVGVIQVRTDIRHPWGRGKEGMWERKRGKKEFQKGITKCEKGGERRECDNSIRWLY